MTSAIARPTFTFHFHLLTSFSQSSPTSKSKTQFTNSYVFPKIPKISVSLLYETPKHSNFITNSIDVSKEDAPTSERPTLSPIDTPEPLEEEKFDERRIEEKFAVLNTGIYECRSCGYKFDEAVGDSSYPIPPGLPFEKLPEDWRCPTCGAAKSFFESKSVEIAGFAQNQQYGLGGNTLTSGQKLVLIYGSLLVFFVLFLSGYFLQ